MELLQHLQEAENKVVGFSIRPDLQKEVNGSKYFDLRIPKATQQSLELQKNQLIDVLMILGDRSEKFKKETSERTGGLKIYVPSDVVKELELKEDSLVDVFISKD